MDPKDGRSFHLTHTPVVHQDGSVSKMTVYRETTSMRKIEARLRQGQKMESLGTLAGGIAHDFNNILSPIIGYSEMLLAGSLDADDARDALSSILQAARRARDLVRQILTFSRQRRYELKPIRIQEVVGEALKLARASLPSTITIRQDIDPQCRRVMADATEVHQIAMNLVTNAFHAMKKAGGVLTVSLRQLELAAEEAALRETAPGTYVCLTVADTGVGMDRRTLDNLFDPYFTTRGEGEGTGLGLAVVHGIVKGHGGHINVSSELGTGTKLEVFLPTVPGTGGEESSAAVAALRTGHESILLVDDQREVLSTLQTMLVWLGYRVSAWTSSVDALLITDLTMPHLTGDRLAVEIMKIRRDMPVIPCTGFSERVDGGAIASLGIREWMMKPISLNDLSARIRRILDAGRAPT